MALSVDAATGALEIPNCEQLLDPQGIYSELVEKGPVVKVKTQVGSIVYLITRWAEGMAALNDSRIAKGSAHMQAALSKTGKSGPASGFPISGAQPGNLLNTDPPDHTRLRSLVNLAFSPRRLESMRKSIEDLVDALLARLEGREEADVIGDFAYPIGITVICDMLGVPLDQRNNFRQWAAHAMTPGHEQQQAGITNLREYLARLIADKRSQIPVGATPDGQKDLLSAMIATEIASDKLSDVELQSMAYLLLIAGHETTVGLIGNALLHLMRNPDQMALLRDDSSLIKQAIEETLRYDGSVHRTTFRVTTEDVEIGGATIPAGSFVQVLISALNRDKDRFIEPAVFDITRKQVPHAAFGHGAHFCLGSHLARIEAQTAVSRILRMYPNMQLAVPAEQVSWVSTVIRGAQSLPVHLGKRVASVDAPVAELGTPA
jgi:cytochrome P450